MICLEAVVLDLSRSSSSFSAAGPNGCLDLSSRCYIDGVNKSRSWRNCSGVIAWWAKDNVDLFRHSSEIRKSHWTSSCYFSESKNLSLDGLAM